MDDIDFKAKVSRQEFEDLCSDLFQRVPGPVQQALSSAEMNMVGRRKRVEVVGQTRVRARAGLPAVCGALTRAETQGSPERSRPKALSQTPVPVSNPQDAVDQVILVGGATRVPKVQEVLLKAVGK